MKQIENNDYYEINVDLSKNRMYLKVIGFWKKPDLVPNYVKHIESAGKSLERGFTLLADLREMKTPPLILNPVHQKAQEALVREGLDRTAEVFSNIVLKTVTASIANESNMKKQVFPSIIEAEMWLNS